MIDFGRSNTKTSYMGMFGSMGNSQLNYFHPTTTMMLSVFSFYVACPSSCWGFCVTFYEEMEGIRFVHALPDWYLAIPLISLVLVLYVILLS